MKTAKSVQAFTTLRKEGNARDSSTLRKMLSARGLPANIATGRQTHGDRIAVVPRLSKPKEYPGIDGFLTAEMDQPLGIFTADCASIFLSAPSQGVIGLLHAGWRGVQGGILAKAVRVLRSRWECSPKDVEMWFGPHIGACCFEVRWDVARHFPGARRRNKDRWLVSLEKELRRQARRLGIRIKSSAAAECTRHPTRYHSYRRDQTDQRQISVIMRPGR